MKRYSKVVFLAGSIIILFFILKGFYLEQKIDLKDSKLNYESKYKGLKEARDFVIDEDGNCFVAYKDKVQVIHNNGKSFDLFMDKSLNITSMEYKKRKLYFASKNEVYSYDIDTKEKKQLINDLPNIGDYNESIIRVRGEEIFISIGAATNSGIVGSDNGWAKEKPFNYDLSPKDITVKGKSFGSEKTGAFVPYKTRNTAGQIIPGHFPGNASIIRYNISTGNYDNFVWGIRNVTGMSFNSEGKLITAVGGMEDRGLRPIKGDVDYIYEVKEGLWYGWPDYSGGDPVSSPRFKGDNGKTQSFVLENHPTTNPSAPIYQHKQLSSIGALEVDNKGSLGDKDCIYFFDKRDNTVYALKKSGALSEKISLPVKSHISSIKICKDNMFMLDNSNGILYKVSKNAAGSDRRIDNSVYYYLLSVVLLGIIIALWRFIPSNNKKE